MNVIISKRKFRCAYCGKIKTGAYRIVDGERSCEKCNRAYDVPIADVKVTCPVCNGKGYIEQ